MLFYRLSQSVRLLAMAAIFVSLASCDLVGQGDGPEEVIDPLFVGGGGGGPPVATMPTVAAPTPPARAPADVISLFSGVYTNVAVDTFNAGFSSGSLTSPDFMVGTDAIKEYTGLGFSGIETTTAPLDVSGMTNFRMDIWTPDDTSGGEAFRVKWVDTGPNGMVEFPSVDNTEAELTFTASTTPALATGSWVTLDIPLSSFTGAGLGALTQLAQLIISGDLPTVYIDNIYFYNASGGGVAGTGITPDDLLVSRDPGTTPVDLIAGVDYAQTQAFGSGSVFDPAFTGDSSYGTVFSVTTGTGYTVPVGQLAFQTFTAGGGFAAAYTNVEFKAKGLNNDLIRVRFIEPDGATYVDVPLTSSGYSTSLGDGWYQVQIPVTDIDGSATATGILFETDNTAAANFTFYLTDVGFSGAVGGTAGPGITPDDLLVSRDPGTTPVNLVAGVDYAQTQAFGSGSVFDPAFTGDSSYGTVFSVTTGTGYTVPVGQLAFQTFTAGGGFAAAYTNVEFKAKGLNNDLIRVRFIEPDGATYVDVPLTSSGYSTSLGDGWYQVQIPVTDIDGSATATGILFETDNTAAANFTFYLTDVGFSGAVGGTAGPGITPDDLLVSRDPGTTPVDLIAGVDYAQTQAFGSGSVFDPAFTGDSSYGTVFSVTTGTGYTVPVGQLAFQTFTAGGGFAAAYTNVEFKAKGLNNDLIRVRFIEPDGATYVDVPLTSSGYSTSLGDGWYQVQIPVTDIDGSATATGILFETDNTAAANFTFYLTDVGFSGSATAGAGITPDDLLVSRDPGTTPVNLVAGVDYAQTQAFGSGSVFDPAFTGDSSYGTVFSVTTGTGYTVPVGQLAFQTFTAGGGFAAAYTNVEFKAKGLNNDLIRVRFIEPDGATYVDVPLTSSGYSTSLGDGWYQVQIPVTDIDGSATATGILFETDNTAAANFTFYLTDVGFSGSATAGAGITPDDLLVSRDPGTTPVNLVAGVDYAQTQAFGSGSVFDPAFTGDSSYGTAFAVTTGTGYTVPVGQLAFQTFTAGGGFAAGYGTLDFKAKGLNNDLIRVRFIEPDGAAYVDVDLTSSGYSTSLGDGWYQVQIPITDIDGSATATGVLFETDNTAAANFTFYLTDVGFSGTPGISCTPTGNNLAVNGDFETGGFDCTDQTPGAGTQTIVTVNPSSGTYAANVNLVALASNSVLKFANLTPGGFSVGQTVYVSFDARGAGADGGVVFAEFFSEITGGGVSSSEILFGGPLTLNGDANVWTPFSTTATTGSDTSGGITLQFAVVTGGAGASSMDFYVDNVCISTVMGTCP